MSPSNSRWPTWVRAVTLSLVGFALLGLLIWKADAGRVMSVLGDADAKWIGLMLVALVAATLLGAINSYLMAAAGSGLNFWSFLGPYWCAWALGQVVPGQVGDLIGISLFLRRRGLSLPAAVGRLGVDKLISLFCLLALSAGLMAIYDAPLARVAGLLGTCAALLVSTVYFLSLRWSVAPISGAGLRSQFMHAFGEAHIVVKTRPAMVAANMALTLLKLVVIGLCYWATFHALHSSTTSFVDVTVTANSAGLIAYIPVSANGVGTVEAGGVYLFGLLGVSTPVVVAAYLILRIANFALSCIGVALVLVFSAEVIGKTCGRSRLE